MGLSLPAYRRTLFVCAAIIVVVAIILAVGVIGPVKDEVARGGSPQMALNAFWINIGITLFAAVSLIIAALRSKGRSWLSTSAQIVIALIVLILGLTLIDAASAYSSHGPPMRIASIIMYICAAADILVGIMVFITALLQRKKA